MGSANSTNGEKINAYQIVIEKPEEQYVGGKII
jgi:hypothetical protein